MKHDVAPPYTAVARHAVFPEPSHDEAARFDFLANFNKYMAATLGPGNQAPFAQVDARTLGGRVSITTAAPADSPAQAPSG